MRVLIDTLSIRREKAGVGIYAKNLIDKLLSMYPNCQFYILGQNDDEAFNYTGLPNASVVRVSAGTFRSFGMRVLFEQLVLPLLLLKHRIDVVHSLHYSFPLFRFKARQVVTIHDMTFFLMPEMHVRIKVLYFRFFIRAARVLADATIFVSESSQRDCVALFGPMPRRSVVIPLGTSPILRRDRSDNSKLPTVGRSNHIYGRFLFYVGTIEPRKNLGVLIRAYSAVAAMYPQLKLVIAGGKGWHNEFEKLQATVLQLNLIDRVFFAGFISEEEKHRLLSAAEVFIYPSLYEGFGLPVLEAFAHGIPTITSNVSSIPEVAGDAAILVDPTNVEAMSFAISRVLSDPALRADLSRRGLARASEFNWDRTAASTYDLYRSLNPTEKTRQP